jgi:hypothetical protein
MVEATDMMKHCHTFKSQEFSQRGCNSWIDYATNSTGNHGKACGGSLERFKIFKGIGGLCGGCEQETVSEVFDCSGGWLDGSVLEHSLRNSLVLQQAPNFD